MSIYLGKVKVTGSGSGGGGAANVVATYTTPQGIHQTLFSGPVSSSLVSCENAIDINVGDPIVIEANTAYKITKKSEILGQLGGATIWLSKTGEDGTWKQLIAYGGTSAYVAGPSLFAKDQWIKCDKTITLMPVS